MPEKIHIQYTISMECPQTHIFHVSIKMDQLTNTYQDFKMAVWTPGSYLVREFSKNVHSASAHSKGNPLQTEKISKNVWRVKTEEQSQVIFEYNLYAFEKTVRTSFLDVDMAMINGASVFMIPDGYEGQELDITIEPFHQWQRITTTLESYKGSKDRFKAKNFDDLIDSPIQVGNHQIESFHSQGVLHEYAITSTGNFDKKKLLKESQTIINEIQSVFGDSPPYEYYIFFLHLVDNTYGGLEHCNSCSMIFDRHGFKDRKSYIKFLGLVSHEFFHTWNVKRIRPVELGPFDYFNEVYTKMLWLAEGATSYYDNVFLPRSGVISANEYFDLICDDIKRFNSLPGRYLQTVEESSFDSWIKLYRPDENSINSMISYYLKGGIIFMALDLTLRDLTDGKQSLDDVYRHLWRLYLEEGKGISDDIFKSTCETVGGQSLSVIWNFISSTDEIDISSYIEPFGVELISDHSDKSLKSAGWVGINIKKNSTIISSVPSDGPAHMAGFNAFDEIIAIDDNRVKAESIQKRLKNLDVDQEYTFLISRDGLMRTIAIKTDLYPYDKFKIKKISDPIERQIKLYEGWLKQSWKSDD